MAALALIAVVVGKSEARTAAPRVCGLPVISATAATVWVHILLVGCLLGGAGATTPPPAPPVQPGACQEEIAPGKCYLYAGTNDEECRKFFFARPSTASVAGYRICYYRPDKGKCWAGGPCVVGNTDGEGGSTCDTCVVPPPSAPPPPASPPPSAPPPWWEFCGDATCNSAVADTEAPSSCRK